jgi:hypothetical protein
VAALSNGADTASLPDGERKAGAYEPSAEAIARRAFEIFLANEGESAEANWRRAERELRAEFAARQGKNSRRSSGRAADRTGV